MFFLKGKSGAKHQIDVYWKLNIAGVEQSFCVECKLWNQNIKKEDIAAFVTKLNDIGNARGIFVTTKGYQKGAVSLASYSGITLINANIEPIYKKAILEFSLPIMHDIEFIFEECNSETKLEIERINKTMDVTEISIFNKLGDEIGRLGDIAGKCCHDTEGHFVQGIENAYISVKDRLIAVKEIRYFYQPRKIPYLTLSGHYEAANVVVKYILNNKEISHQLASHRNI